MQQLGLLSKFVYEHAAVTERSAVGSGIETPGPAATLRHARECEGTRQGLV